MPIFLPVNLPGYVDNHGYDPFARNRWLPSKPAQTRKVKKKVRPSSAQKPKSVEQSTEADGKRSKDDLDLDYLGISNMMRSISFKGQRRWKLKNPENDTDQKVVDRKRAKPTKAWDDKASKKGVDDDGEKGQEEEKPVDINALRRSRSSSFIKFKYPKEYHHGPQTQQSALEENIPQCMRHYPRYTNLPMKQNCGYDPYRSVTQLKVHSVKSGSLPHPPLPNSKPKRPMSAPPSYNTTAKAAVHRRSPHKKKQPFAAQNGGNVQEREHNGMYHMVHEDFKVATSPMSQLEFSTITEEKDFDTYSLPAETPRQVVMKADDSDVEDLDEAEVYQDTIVSLENVEDTDNEETPRGKTSIEDRYHSPLMQSVHTFSDNDDFDVNYQLKSDSGGESLLDETEVSNLRAQAKNLREMESDADEVESDY